MNDTEMIAKILEGSNDGKDLHSVDREVIDFFSAASPQEVTEMDELALAELYARVYKGYRPPWFHDLEHLTIDRKGFVSWKSKPLDHFDLPWAFEARAKPHAQKLVDGCRELERLGREVCMLNLVQLGSPQGIDSRS